MFKVIYNNSDVFMWCITDQDDDGDNIEENEKRSLCLSLKQEQVSLFSYF